MRTTREMKVPAIENGTVIDHIPAVHTYKVLQILRLHDELITIGNNLNSKKLGKKGVVKVCDKTLNQDEVNKIAIIAPSATINVIKNYKVAQKWKVELPDVLDHVVQCFNPNCITRKEQVQSRFFVIRKKPATLKCYYCEKTMGEEHIVLL